MVVRRAGPDDPDRLFSALADQTRRDIVRRVLQQEASVSALAAQYDMSFAAVQKHVAVLERAGLVVKERRGREQIVHGDLSAVRAAARLLEQFEDIWRGRIGRIDTVLAQDTEE
jgi:DNA-binding transcriptional ArsR family regulator